VRQMKDVRHQLALSLVPVPQQGPWECLCAIVLAVSSEEYLNQTMSTVIKGCTSPLTELLYLRSPTLLGILGIPYQRSDTIEGICIRYVRHS
jgi:hypothetical protein